MSITRTLALGCTGVALAAGALTAAPVTASGATEACGSACISVFNRGLGTYASPNIVETILDGKAQVGQPVVLLPATPGNTAQDTIPRLRPLSAFHADGLVSDEVAERYGSLNATEIEFAPGGALTGLCVGLADAPRQGQGLTLQPCRQSARTVWIVDTQDAPATAPQGYFAIVSAATTNVRRPYAMDYAGAAAPGEPVEPIRVRHLRFTGKEHTLSDRQLWGVARGVIG